MARAFGNNNANFLNRSSSLISLSNPRPMTCAVWLYALSRSDKGLGYSHWILSNNYPDGGPNMGLSVRPSGANDVLGLYSATIAQSSTFNLAVNAWNHLAWTWDTSNNAGFYFNGAALTGATQTLGTAGTSNGAALGRLNATSGLQIDGSLAEFGFWNAILSAGEVAALARGASPRFVSPTALVAYVPIWGIHSPEIDLTGAATWAINGTLNQSNHAPVVPSTRPRWSAAPLAQTATGVYRDTATRFRLRSATVLRDTAARFRLASATTLRDTATRLRLQAQAFRDTATRFRLRSAATIRDTAARFRLQSATAFRDTVARYRLASATTYRDTATRFNLATGIAAFRDTAIRYRLRSTAQIRDTTTRYRLRSATVLRDTATRFLLQVDAYSQAVLTDTPSGYWRLNETSGTAVIDSSGNSIPNGSYVNSPTLGTTGLIPTNSDAAVHFNGVNQIADIGNQMVFSGTSTVAVECWINPDSISTTTWPTLVASEEFITTHAGWVLFLNKDDNRVCFLRGDGTLSSQATGPVLSAGQVSHLVVQYDGTNIYIYLDGVSTGSGVANSRVIPTSATRHLTFGGYTSNNYYQGVIDEVAIYNHTLTSARILAHYNAGIGSIGLQGYRNTAFRFRLRSVALYRDTTARFRLLAAAFRDTTTRFRLRSVLLYRDTASRFRLVSPTTLRDTSSRFRLQGPLIIRDTTSRVRVAAQSYRDTAFRFRLTTAGQVLRDTASRYRLQVATTRDTAARFRLQGPTIVRDTATRLRVAALAYRDTASRFRLLTQGIRDTSSRYRLAAQTYRDTAFRFRMQTAGQVLRDTASRFRVQGPTVLRDTASRFRLGSVTLVRDSATRYRLRATAFRDTTTQFRLSQPSIIRDTATRFRLTIPGLAFRDTRIRFGLASLAAIRDTAFRFNLARLGYRDTATRLRIAAATTRDTRARFRVELSTARFPGHVSVSDVAAYRVAVSDTATSSVSIADHV